MGQTLRKFLLIGAAITLLSMSAMSQTCLSFDEAVRIAADNDPAVRIARADLDNAEASLQEARSLTRPQISAFGRTGIGDNGLVDSQIENQIGLRASQRIYDFGDSRLARQASQETVTAQKNFILDARATAALEAGLEFITWLEAMEQLQATRERISYFDQQLQAVEALLDTGGSTILDQAEVAAEKATAQAQKFEFEFRRDQAGTKVTIATGVQQNLCQTSGSVFAAKAKHSPDPDELETLIASAMQSNPRLQALRRTSAGLDATAKRERRARLPIIDVVGIASYASEEFTSDYELQNRIGVNVTVPIFSGSALDARTRQARARASRSDGELAVARRRMREDIEVTYRRTLLLEDLMLRRQDIFSLKTKQFEGALTEYKSGLRTLQDLIDVRLELEASALSEIEARFDLDRERLRLAALTGSFPDDLDKADPVSG